MAGSTHRPSPPSRRRSTSERYGRPLQAISVVYPKYPTVDESRYVVPLADRLGLPLHTYEQETNPLDGLARWTALADTPFPGAAMAQYEEDFRRVRALGLRTILTGEHAEFVAAMQWNTLSHFLTHGRLRARASTDPRTPCSADSHGSPSLGWSPDR